MIVGAFGPRTVNKLFGLADSAQITDDRGVSVSMPYFVLREATEAEWIAEQIADGFWGPVEQLRYKYNPRATYFYEVSVD